LSLRVPNNEARQALVRLRLAFEEAERLIPGVSCALVAEIVEGVEQVDEDGR
jgi:serine/threonine-protein kinase 24/25/MST4